jgi:pre-mRNA-splicing factor SYF2
LEAYKRRKAIATGGGVLNSFDATGSSSVVQVRLKQQTHRYEKSNLTEIFQASGSVEQRLAHDNFYRDASTLIYADDKPTEEAIDRVVSKINKE